MTEIGRADQITVNRKARVVKLGRKALVPPLAYHWAIQVGEKWYEIAPMTETKDGNKINTNYGEVAASTAGILGGSIVGETEKTDQEIDKWNKDWLAEYPEYDLITDNCQKYVVELMVWLTDNKYYLDCNLDAANLDQTVTGEKFWTNDGFAVEEDGIAIASYTVGQSHVSAGPFNAKTTVGQFTAEAVAGPGIGVFADTTFIECEANVGNLIGVHVGLNADTGIGIKGGNAEAHVLGFGGQVGADGLEVNTPVIGAHICCTIM